MTDKKYEIDMYFNTFKNKKQKSVPLNTFIQNWKKMEKKNHVKDKFSFTIDTELSK